MTACTKGKFLCLICFFVFLFVYFFVFEKTKMCTNYKKCVSKVSAYVSRFRSNWLGPFGRVQIIDETVYRL